MIPNLDNLEACHDYLRDLGAKHQQHGVRREHLDLMALVYCSAIRGVVATQGIDTSSDHVLGYFSLLEENSSINLSCSSQCLVKLCNYLNYRLEVSF